MQNWKAFLLGATILSLSVEAGSILDRNRASLACELRNSHDCRSTAVFIRDLKDNCILDKQGKASNCLITFCSSNCALPRHQSIAPEAHALCTEHCREVDLTNHKLQERLANNIEGALTEEQVKARFTDMKALERRNAKEQANYNATFGSPIAQLRKAALDRVKALREAKYYQFKYDTAQKTLEMTNEFFETTKESLASSGFTPEELEELLKDARTAEETINTTPAEKIQITTPLFSLINTPTKPISSSSNDDIAAPSPLEDVS